MVSEVGQSLFRWPVEGWPWVVNHLWQSTLFALLLLTAALLVRRSPARLRYSLSLLASLKFALPAALAVAVGSTVLPGLAGFLPELGVPGLDLSALASSLTPLEIPLLGLATTHLVALLAAVWLLGALVLAVRWFRQTRALARRVGAGVEVSAGAIFELLELARQRTGVGRRVRLVLLSDAVEPGVFRVFRPTLVLPAAIVEELGNDELEAIFLHELTHVSRWDNLVASLHMLLCCVFWFHPLVWWLDRRLLREREEACDERVLALGGRADAYAKSLLKVVRFGLGWRLAGVSGASSSDFRQRIERILMRSSCPERRSLTERLLLSAAVVLLVGFSWVAGGNAPAVGSDLAKSEGTAVALGVQPPSGVQAKCLRSQTSAARSTAATNLAAVAPSRPERSVKTRGGTPCPKVKKPQASTAVDRLAIARRAEPDSGERGASAEEVVVTIPSPEPVH